jgi:hypothetical protein
MSDLCRLIWCAVIGLFQSRAALQAEILVLRHQLNVLRRKSPQRVTFINLDRFVFTGLYRFAPTVLDAFKILKPETLIRWHRAGFRAYWRWKSRPRGGRPGTAAEIRQLISEMSIANPLWGAPRIHGELLKLGIDAGQTTVAKYMARRRRPPSQGWKTFLRNHADTIISMDLFVVPTVSFRLLYGFLVLRHCRRELLWLSVTAHPNAEWIARQLTEACGWQEAPRYVVRDRDGALWRGLRPAPCRNGHTGPTDLGAVTMAKWICGEGHWFDPPGLSRSRRGVRRGASSSPAQFIPKILQRGPHAPLAAQRCAGSA